MALSGSNLGDLHKQLDELEARLGIARYPDVWQNLDRQTSLLRARLIRRELRRRGHGAPALRVIQGGEPDGA